MTTPLHRILVTGMEADISGPYVEKMINLGFEIEVQADPAIAERLLLEESFDAVVAGFPMVPGALGKILETMRTSGSHNHGSGLILMAAPERLRGAAGLVGRGVNKALSIKEDPTVLGIVVQRMIEFAQPMAERLNENLEFSAEIGTDTIVWTTANISGSGMLVCTTTPPTIGTVFRFTMTLPTQEIAGTARVVRYTVASTEVVSGFGSRFMSFEVDGRARLLDFLREAHQRTASGRHLAIGKCPKV